MSRRLDIACACYGKPQQLQRTVAAIQKHSATDWRLYLIVNPHPRVDMREVVSAMADRDKRIVPVWLDENVGYAGAVNAGVERCKSEYFAYLDDDATVETYGWDEALCGYLDRFHEIGVIFPNGGAYPIQRGAYVEIQWGVGFCFVANMLCINEVSSSLYGVQVTPAMADDFATWGFVGFMDTGIGHQNECDACLKVRMCGWKCAAAPGVLVRHEATATNDSASNERIARGVREFVDKWCRAFYGKDINYHSPNVGRWEEWPPNQIYMEQYWKSKPETAGLNDNPEVMRIDGREYDLIRIPKFKDFYRSRIF